jgi:hypothetical protein
MNVTLAAAAGVLAQEMREHIGVGPNKLARGVTAEVHLGFL